MNVAKSIKDIVCFNQGEIAQYTYLSSVFHKALKECLLKDEKNFQDISLHFRALSDYLNKNLERICKRNFKLLQDYFSDRSLPMPRVCLKVNEGDEKISDLFREDSSSYQEAFYLQDNTGFAYVIEKGRYFLCNNIPLSYIRGEYKNSRLDDSQVDDYKFIALLGGLIGRKKGNDRHWAKLWKSRSDDLDQTESLKGINRSCYKSTIIIPMTLWNNDLSEDYKLIMGNNLGINSFSIERTIFGFLCFDDVVINYFTKRDVDVGYVVADLLSLYFITYLNYSNWSKTFIKASELLKKST